MPDPIINQNIDQLTQQAFAALVSKGIYCLLFPVKTDKTIDKTVNYLNGIPVGNITAGDESADSEEYQDQLAGGIYKNFISGAIDPSDITMTTYFSPTTAQFTPPAPVQSVVVTPQMILILAVESAQEGQLQGFFAAGCNYSGGRGLDGSYGSIVKSSLKFKLSGKPKRGFIEVGTFDKTLYGGGPSNTNIPE
ncbi:hypothetical protein FACS18942_05010 [Planctomycetales bacterium]|nr:hypothetical protein FACS18942_05010 [Planctomycetales bacterium]GHT37042.1 hypothetical protein FACS189427_09520 [Planctomycetales bacterium]